MKRLLAVITLVLLPTIALAGDIPGSNPDPPPCTENCLLASEESNAPDIGEVPETLEVTVMRVLLDLFATAL